MTSPTRPAGFDLWRWLLLALVLLGGLAAGPALASSGVTAAAPAAAGADGRWRQPATPVEAAVLRRSGEKPAPLPPGGGDDAAPAEPAEVDAGLACAVATCVARLVAATPRIRPGRDPPTV